MSMFTALSTDNKYIVQYLKVASAGNVYLTNCPFDVTGELFNRFKCSKCHDNFNVKTKLFWDNALPQELQDWVKLHRHPDSPCKWFQYKDAIMPNLCICGFGKNVHDFVCVKCGLFTKGQKVCSSCTLAEVKNWAPGKILEVNDPLDVAPGYTDYFITSAYNKMNPMNPVYNKPIAPAPTATLPEHKGRKFRA